MSLMKWVRAIFGFALAIVFLMMAVSIAAVLLIFGVGVVCGILLAVEPDHYDYPDDEDDDQ